MITPADGSSLPRPAARPQAGENASLRHVLAWSLVLVVYGNAGSLVVGTATPEGWWPGVLLGILLTCITLVAAWRIRLTAAQLGLASRRFLRSALLGLAVAIGVAGLALLVLRFPPLVGQPVEYAPLGSLSKEAVLWRTFVWMPLDTVIPEELAFRGVLLGMLLTHYSRVPAIMVSALVFAAWHGVVISHTLASTNLQSSTLLASLGVIGALGAVFMGGVLFAWIRLGTDHLAGSVVAHWAFNAVVLLGLGAM